MWVSFDQRSRIIKSHIWRARKICSGFDFQAVFFVTSLVLRASRFDTTTNDPAKKREIIIIIIIVIVIIVVVTDHAMKSLESEIIMLLI